MEPPRVQVLPLPQHTPPGRLLKLLQHESGEAPLAPQHQGLNICCPSNGAEERVNQVCTRVNEGSRVMQCVRV